MASLGEGTVKRQGKARTLFISVPSSVVTDSRFPFHAGDRVKIRITNDGRGLMIERKQSSDLSYERNIED